MNETNVWLAWALVLVPSAIIFWCIAAFLLRAGRPARFRIATGIPALATAAFLFAGYWASRTPPAEPGWDIFYALASLVAGAFTIIVTAPVARVAEWVFARSAA